MHPRDNNPWPLRWILATLLLALVVRVALVANGGQGFWPDEVRYQASQEAVRRLAEGKVRSALGSAVAEGDHPGFKLLGILPAALAHWTGERDLRLPAAFFTVFSWMTLVFLWGCLRRAGATLDAQAWIVGVAGLSTSLAFYTRHLLPYDAALALAFGALYVGWKEGAAWRRTFVAGTLAGMALLVYLGYWLIVLVVLVLLGCNQREKWWRRLVRWTAAGAGFCTSLLGVWLIDRLGEGTMVENARRFSGSVTQGDFGSGYRLVWEYFWSAEGALAGLWLAATIWLAWQATQRWRAGLLVPRIWLLGLGAAGAVYAGLLFFSDIIPKFVVYGRTARQLTPFLAVVTGLALAEWLRGRPRAAFLAGIALAGNFAWQIFPALTVGYPREFKKQAAVVLAGLPKIEPGTGYYRLVNVDQYVYEAEQLPYDPEATLRVAKHPYEFEPFLYEGSSALQRTQRRTTDHRMRLVRMAVPPALRVAGERYGKVQMRLSFVAGRIGMSEPLLSLGERDNGDLFFVRYLSNQQLVFGMESMGASVQLGSPVVYEPGRVYDLELFSGALLPPGGEGLTESQALFCRNLVSVRLGGTEVLRAIVPPHRIEAADVYAGYNFVRAGSAITAFSGEIASVVRGGLPPMDSRGTEYGPIRMLVKMPAATAGIPEPLVVAGISGQATLVYVRVMAGDLIKIGVEVWGWGAWESEPVKGGSGRSVEIVVSCPAFLPAPEASAWAGVEVEKQQAARGRLRAWVDGALVLDHPAPAAASRSEPVFYGNNPVGGSLVSDAFTGELLQVSRLPLAER